MFDINEIEIITEVFFDRFEIDTEYVVSISHLSQKLKEQFKGEFRYIQLKGNLIKGKVEGLKPGHACNFHFPRGIYSKIKNCYERNSKNITTYDVVRISFVKINKRNWRITKLEVENVLN